MTYPSNLTEEQEQELVCRYLELLRLDFLHIPNEGKRSYSTAARLKKIGMRPGFPDLFVLRPTERHHGLAIEMKRTKGGTLTDRQKAWIMRLNQLGYKAVCCHGFEEAKQEIDKYLKGAEE